MSANLFTLASNDQSVYYLGQIFGNIPGILPLSNGPLLLGVLFKVLNTAALSVGAMIVTYTTVVGLLATASEGEFLGKKWSGLWVPIRTVLGIVGLFPSAGGYCAIQMIIMWLILQGVGLADALWTTTMTFIQQTGTPYARVDFPEVISGKIAPMMKSLFKGLVCRESMLATYDIPKMTDKTKVSYYCYENPSDPSCEKKLLELAPNANENPDNLTYDLGFGCGTVTLESNPKNACINNPESLNCILAKAQVSVMPGIISVVDTIAQRFVQIDYEYQNFYYTSTLATGIENANPPSPTTPEWITSFCVAKSIQYCCADPAQKNCSSLRNKYSPISSNQRPDSVSSNVLKEIYLPYNFVPYLNNVDFIAPVVNQYMGALAEAYTNYWATLPLPQLSGWQKKAEENGWIFAGMYYYNIAKMNAAHQVSIDNLPVFSVLPPSPPAIPKEPSSIPKYRNNLNLDTDALFEAIAGQLSSGGYDLGAMTGKSRAIAAAWAPTNSILSGWMKNLTDKNANPLVQLAAFGYKLMYTTQIVFFVTLLAVSIVAGVLGWSVLALGSGMTANPMLEYFKLAWGLISPFFILMIASLYSMGAIIGIYLPLLPYIIFTMGAIGWIMTTLEAMVAGPLIALGILSPSGQHELLGKAEPAVMILFNLILRPGLMIFGMMASMFVAIVVIKMINTGFDQVAHDIISKPGLFEIIAFFVVYVSLITMALNKVFSLIHVIPEKVLMYIGGQAISYGESEGLAGAKQALEGSTGAITGASKETSSNTAGGAAKALQDTKMAKEKPKDPSIQAGGGAAQS